MRVEILKHSTNVTAATVRDGYRLSIPPSQHSEHFSEEGRSDNIKLTNRLDLNDVLKTLPFAVDASFNAYQRQHDPTCLPNTCVDLLQEIYNWADGENSPSIFWLNDLAGTGKSTIARTLVARYSIRAALQLVSSSPEAAEMVDIYAMPENSSQPLQFSLQIIYSL